MNKQLLFGCVVALAMSGFAETAESMPQDIDGIYPHLAMQNDEDECGTGAVVPWAGSLWVVTYGPHCPNGSSDKLYQISPDLKRVVRKESVGGTPANRLIHRETNQLLIGPYVIDAKGNVRVVPPSKMPGRLTGAGRHLVDPANKVYVATMDNGLYTLDMKTLAVKTLQRDHNGEDGKIWGRKRDPRFTRPADWEQAVENVLPGSHTKGMCTGFGRIQLANNGEYHPEALTNPWIPAGVLGDCAPDGTDQRVIRRCQFTDITTKDGINGNEHPDANPVWALGWDAKSVILAVATNGNTWTYFRLPKASHCYDGAHGWNTEWPRIREAGLGGGDLLATMHGTFWRFPKSFSPATPNGIRPISTYLKVIGDFCYWKDAPNGGSIVFGCDDNARSEFLGKRKLKADQPKNKRSTSNLWFVKPQDLKTFGPPTGEGWVWHGEDVKAGDLSDPYLWEGYSAREFSFMDAAGRPVPHELVHEGDWVRVKALADAKGVRAHFVYGLPEPAASSPLDGKRPFIDVTDDNGKIFRFPNVNGDTNVLCREVATERDLLYVGGVFYEVPAENAGGFACLRPIALADEPVRSIAVDRGLVVVNGKRRALDSLWRNGTAAQAWGLWRKYFLSGAGKRERLQRVGPDEIRLGGEFERRIMMAVTNNLLQAEIEKQFLDHFREKSRTGDSVGTGKLIEAAVRFGVYTKDPRVIALKNHLVDELLKAQSPDGYIGALRKDSRLWGYWDLAETGFIFLGLVADHRYFGNERSLAAARRAADYMIANWPTMPKDWENAYISGTAAAVGFSWGLHALYEETGDVKYRDFAVKARRLDTWYRPVTIGRGFGIHGHSATHLHQCLMQCLYRTAGVATSRRATDETVRFMLDGNGTLVTGACGLWECWTDDQTGRLSVGETCSTGYQLWLWDALARECDTPDPRWGDAVERTVWNALFGAQSETGRRIRYYIPLEGARSYYPSDTYCCPNNFRRIVSELPEFTFYKATRALYANLYTTCSLETKFADGVVRVRETTDYPTADRILFDVTPEGASAAFDFMLRIPGWCDKPTLSVNDERVPVAPGTVAHLDRVWRKGDRVELVLPMRVRTVAGRCRQAGRVAFLRGPLVYALDPALNGGGVKREAIGTSAETAEDQRQRKRHVFFALDPSDICTTMLVDPATIRVVRDDTVRPNGTALKIRAATAGHATGVTEKNSSDILLTEFPDVNASATYFRISDLSIAEPDDLFK